MPEGRVTLGPALNAPTRRKRTRGGALRPSGPTCDWPDYMEEWVGGARAKGRRHVRRHGRAGALHFAALLHPPQADVCRSWACRFGCGETALCYGAPTLVPAAATQFGLDDLREPPRLVA